MITKEQYKEAQKIIKDYEAQQVNRPVVVNSVCEMNRKPDECSVNLYTQSGCKGCYYFKK